MEMITTTVMLMTFIPGTVQGMSETVEAVKYLNQYAGLPPAYIQTSFLENKEENWYKNCFF